MLLASLIGASLPGQIRTEWRTGISSVPITPPYPIWLAGYGSRNRPSGKVLQDIFAKAVALEDKTGSITVLVTIDLLGSSRTLSDQVSEQAWKEQLLSVG